MSRRDSNHHSYWFFFPFVGLFVPFEKDWHSNALFGDASLVPANALEKDLQECFKEDEKNGNFMIKSIKVFEEKNNFGTYVAVRRSGNIKESKNHNDSRARQEMLEESATERAIACSALLTVVGRAAQGWSCRLFEFDEFSHKRGLVVGIEEYGKGMLFKALQDKYSTPPLIGNHFCEKGELSSLLGTSPYDKLSKIISGRNYPKGISRIVSEATIRLADASLSIDLSQKLLGSVTTIEILLAVADSKYESILDLAEALLGEAFVKKNRLSEVLRARHKYVHQGTRIADQELSMFAAHVALSCLLRFCELAEEYPNKITIANYLEIISTISKFSRIENISANNMKNRFLSYTGKGYELPKFISLK